MRATFGSDPSTMRKSYLLISVAFFFACGGAPPNGVYDIGGTDTLRPPDSLLAPMSGEVDWTGYYDGSFSLGRGRDMAVQLWVRTDSVFIIRKHVAADDSVADGAIGNWRVVRVMGGPPEGLLQMQYGGDPPDHYQHTAEGLVFVDVINGVDLEGTWALEKLADELQDQVPRMRVQGIFTYYADAQSFQPCGATYAWPCVGGMDLGEEEGEPLVPFNNVDLQRAYAAAVAPGTPWVVEVICTLGMGPAMEGDGADEYLFIEQAPRTLKACP